MKRIILEQLYPAPGGYSVYIGQRHSFKSKKSAKAFLAKTARNLTDQAHFINYLLMDAYNLYREVYFNFDYCNSYNFLHERHTCGRLIADAEKSIDLAMNRHKWEDGHTFVFTHLINAIESIIRVSELIHPIHKQLNNYESVYKCEYVLSKANNIRADIYQIKTGMYKGGLEISNAPTSESVAGWENHTSKGVPLLRSAALR